MNLSELRGEINKAMLVMGRKQLAIQLTELMDKYPSIRSIGDVFNLCFYDEIRYWIGRNKTLLEAYDKVRTDKKCHGVRYWRGER